MAATLVETSQRTEATRALLDAVDRQLSEWKGIEIASLLDGRAVEDFVSQMTRARREFDAKLFFVSVFGPLKAGKSTLVNCLARFHVSPTKLGRECTLRPSIVIRADQPGIDVYVRKHSARSDDRQAFHLVIDYLRGLVDEVELNKTVSRRSLPLTPQAVDAQLSPERAEDEVPLITVIRVRGGGFLQDSVALLDSPGLDGGRAGWGASPIHEWISSRSDFLIFVQSSIAAVSREVEAFLADAVHGRKSPPLWIVQNVMDAKHWRSAEERDEETRQQKEEARKHIERVVRRRLASTAINLGKADDGIQHPHHPEMLSESQFERFEAQLLRTLHLERELIHERNSVSGVVEAIGRCRELLAGYQERAAGVLSAHRRVLSDVEECRDRITGIKPRPDANGEQQVKDAVSELEKSWKNEVTKLTELAIQQADRKIPGAEINALLKETARRAGLVGGELLDLNGTVGVKLKQWAASSVEYSERGTVPQVEETLARNQMEPFPTAASWCSYDGSPVRHIPLRYSPVKEKHGGLVSRNYLAYEAQQQIREATTPFDGEIKTRVEDFLIRNNPVSYLMARKASLLDHVSSELDKYLKRMTPTIERAERSTELAERLLDEVEALKPLAMEADCSMSHVTHKENGNGTEERIEETTDLSFPVDGGAADASDDDAWGEPPDLG